MGPGMEEGQTRPGYCRIRGERSERRGRWKRRGMTEEEEEKEVKEVEEEKEDEEEEKREIEGTCYALRDMAEARGIHNFVKTKMLRSCLGGVAFFLVSRNVQARLAPSVLRLLVRALFPSSRSLVPSVSSVALGSALLSLLSCSSFPLLRTPGGLLVRVYLRASSLSRFSGNAPRNEKRFVKNVSASS